jgi:hypothetical protein
MVGHDGAANAPGRLLGLVRDDNHATELAHVTGGAVNDGQWHHCALVRTGNTITLYLNGNSQGTSSSNGAGGPITTNLRAIGAERMWAQTNFGRPEHRFLPGSVADVHIYQRALSIAEIGALARPPHRGTAP